MKRTIFGLLALGAAFCLVACGDDSGTPNKIDGGSDATNTNNDGTVNLDQGDNDGGNQTDGAKTDGTVIGECNAAAIGKSCMQDTDCGEKASCLGLSQTEGGICTCDCTADDYTTPLINEDSCPQSSVASVCGLVQLTDGSTKGFCFQKCSPKLGSNDCQSKFSCSPRSTSVFENSVDSPVCFVFACTANSDCPVLTADDCDTSGTPACTQGTCLAITAHDTLGKCAVDGVCDTASGLCGPHNKGKTTAHVGDTCDSSLDCGNNMTCQFEFDEAIYYKATGASCQTDDECCSNSCTGSLCDAGECMLRNRNGYCIISGCSASTLTEFQCPTGSTCALMYGGGLCMKTCAITDANGCRGNANDKYGDYECRSWNNLSFGGVGAASEPVCDFGPSLPCSILTQIPDGCAVFGTVQGTSLTNPTNFACRRLADGSQTTDPYDANGYCFDDTTSGSL